MNTYNTIQLYVNRYNKKMEEKDRNEKIGRLAREDSIAMRKEIGKSKVRAFEWMRERQRKRERECACERGIEREFK